MALSFSVPDTELSATLHNRRTEIVDAIFKGTPFLNALSTYGGTRTEDGGMELLTPIRMSKNTTVGPFMDYDIIDTTPQESLTTARFAWAAEAGTVSISKTEELRNEGRGRLLNLLDTKIEDLKITMRDQFNIHLLQAQPSAGSKFPYSITELIDVDPTGLPPRGSAAVGNIDASVYTWHRNQYLNGGAFTVSDMNAMWNDVSDGTEFPNFLLTDSTVYEYYENSQVGLIRYGDSRAANLGFSSCMYKTAPMLWDPNIGLTGAIYYINTNYLKLVTHSGFDFVMGDFQEPDNQFAKVAKCGWMGQFELSNRRRCGVIHTITAPA